MAYDRRISELLDQMKSLATDADGPAVEAFSEAIRKYAEPRSKALDKIVDLMDGATIGTNGLQDHWRAIAQEAKDTAQSIIHDAFPEDVMASSSLQAFLVNTLESETRFFEELSKVRTPQNIEDLLTHQGILAQMIDKLTTIWNQLLSAKKEQEDAQMQPVKQIDQIMQDIIREIEQENQSLVAETAVNMKELITHFVEDVREGIKGVAGEKAAQVATAGFGIVTKYLRGQYSPFPSEVDDDLDRYGDRTSIHLEKLKFFAETYRSNAEQYRKLISAERGGVLTMFQKTREQVTEYERNNNLVTAQIMRDEAKRFLDEWADHTAGAQRDDGAEFNKKIFDIVDKNWKVTEEMAKQFEGRFSGVFYAPLTRDTMETLTESYLFKKAIEGVNNRNAVSTIDNLRNLLTGAADEMTRLITQPLDEMSTDWSSDLKEMTRTSNEDFRRHMREKLKSQIDLAMNSLGELRHLIDPPKVVADFTREELDAMLRN